jgi:hypothetical protein
MEKIPPKVHADPQGKKAMSDAEQLLSDIDAGASNSTVGCGPESEDTQNFGLAALLSNRSRRVSGWILLSGTD